MDSEYLGDCQKREETLDCNVGLTSACKSIRGQKISWAETESDQEVVDDQWGPNSGAPTLADQTPLHHTGCRINGDL
jgi:hypothetical protein